MLKFQLRNIFQRITLFINLSTRCPPFVKFRINWWWSNKFNIFVQKCQSTIPEQQFSTGAEVISRLFFFSQFIDSMERMNAKRTRKKWWNHSDLQFMSVAESNCFIFVQFIIRNSHMSVYCRLNCELKTECKRFIVERSRFELKSSVRFTKDSCHL